MQPTRTAAELPSMGKLVQFLTNSHIGPRNPLPCSSWLTCVLEPRNTFQHIFCIFHAAPQCGPLGQLQSFHLWAHIFYFYQTLTLGPAILFLVLVVWTTEILVRTTENDDICFFLFLHICSVEKAQNTFSYVQIAKFSWDTDPLANRVYIRTSIVQFIVLIHRAKAYYIIIVRFFPIDFLC